MSDYSKLLDKYGGDEIGSNDTSNYKNLLDRYSGDKIEATPTEPTEVSTAPKPQTEAEINATITAQKNAPSKPLEVSDIPIVRKIPEGLQQAKGLLGQAVTDYANQRPASALANAAMGVGTGMLTALPILPVLNEGKDQLTKITGNPDFANRAELLATSGLPILKTAKVAAGMAPSTRAIDTIVNAVGPDNLAAGLERLRSNPRLAPMDVFPSVRSMAQGLATEVGPHQTTLLNAVEARKGSMKGAIEGAINEATGAPVNVLDKLNELKTNAQKVGTEKINPLVESAKPAEITSIIKNIDTAISDTPIGAATIKALKAGETPTKDLGPLQQRLYQLRNDLRGPWDDRPNMYLDVKGDQGLHRIQSDLRAEAQALRESADPKDRFMGNKLMNFRNQLVDSIEASKPGYKEALSAYRDEKQIDEAFHKGTELLRNRPTVFSDRPEFLDKWIKDAKPEELAAAREGGRIAVDQQINGMRNAVGKKGVEIPDVDFNVKKMELLYGKEEARTMFRKLKDEKDIADTNQKIWEGSQTQFRAAGGKAIEVRPDHKPSINESLPFIAEGVGALTTGLPGVGAGTLTGYHAIRNIYNKIGQKLDRKTNVELAKLASSTGEARQALIDALSQRIPGPKKSLLQKTQNTLLPILPP